MALRSGDIYCWRYYLEYLREVDRESDVSNAGILESYLLGSNDSNCDYIITMIKARSVSGIIRSNNIRLVYGQSVFLYARPRVCCVV